MKNQTKTQDQLNSLKSLALSIAHETRNPLSAVSYACSAIKDSLEEVSQYLDLISISAARGLSIIDMTLLNVRDGQISSKNFVNDLSIANIVNKALDEYVFENVKDRHAIELDLEDDFRFRGDETLMVFVLFNLLKNALYQQVGIRIWLEMGGEGGDKEGVNCLYFKDDGRGIDEDKLPFIFDDFFTSDKKGGTGLGLPFCKRVMKAFGGDIACKSIKGEGVEFCLQFSSLVDCGA